MLLNSVGELIKILIENKGDIIPGTSRGFSET